MWYKTIGDIMGVSNPLKYEKKHNNDWTSVITGSILLLKI